MQVQEVNDDLQRARIVLDATQGWMEKKNDEELEASRKKSSQREARSKRRNTKDSAGSGRYDETSDSNDSSYDETATKKHKGLKTL